MEQLIGTILLSVSGFSAASFYVPSHKVKEWTHGNRRTRAHMWLGILTLLLSVIMIGIGNNLATTQ